MKNIIDSHVHLDMIERHHPHRIQWFRENACSVVSWSYFDKAHRVFRMEELLRSKAQFIKRHRTAGLDCYYLAGIHPRCMPDDLRPEHVETLLQPPLEDPLCRGIGEIGLETGDSKEQEILIAQLETGRRLLKQGKVIGIHTPRANKTEVTKTTLKMLDSFKDISSSIVVDHCTIETIPDVLAAGFWAGVTLSPAKTSWDEMRHIASIYSGEIHRIMCNTDSGSEFCEDLVQASRSDDLPEEIRDRVFYKNAALFFNLAEINICTGM